MLAAYQQKGGKDTNGVQVWASAEGAKVQFIAIVEANQLKGGPGLDAAATQMIAAQMDPLIQSLAGLGSAPRQVSGGSPKAPVGTIVIQGLGPQ